MNRIVLIGNGFDLAHGLPTRYEDFIDWYWGKRAFGFNGTISNISKDILCEFEVVHPHLWNEFAFQTSLPIARNSGKQVIQYLKNNPDYFKIHSTPFYENICQSIETKGWVDIENEYYRLLTRYVISDKRNDRIGELNRQLDYITKLLAEYLLSVESSNPVQPIESICNHIYSPINSGDISIESGSVIKDCVDYWMGQEENVMRSKIQRYHFDEFIYLEEVSSYKRNHGHVSYSDYPRLFRLPEYIMLLDFNYTSTSKLYCNNDVCMNVHIHGELNHPESMIFGYGDEQDDNYKALKEYDNNECLRNIKTAKYLEASNYRSLLGFMEWAPFQVLIMGHSCGNSDRTLLNTMFEHKNCISIKPYYHQKADGTDNYLDIIQNISRNFSDMKRMRDRVVNKTLCEPLT